MNDSPEYIAKVEFLKKAIPGLAKMSATARDRICRSFEEKTCFPGHNLFQEGTPSREAYLLIDGNVELYSNQVPLNSSAASAMELFLDRESGLSKSSLKHSA
jgi:hypothetical protein